jgi:hypothetical protein
MVLKYIPSYKGIGETSVIAAAADDAIQHAAHAILSEAQRLAEDAGDTEYAAALHIDTGARPKGRGYARVVADAPDAAALEWGDNATERLRILGRAAGIQIFPDVPK